MGAFKSPRTISRTEYFKKALRQPPGAVYVSPIELNKENGAIESPHVPVLRFATSLQTPDGQPFGILIINVDMRRAFAGIREAMRPGRDIFIINERGDYLVNPQLDREFGFEFGRPARLQDDFPALAHALEANEASSEMIRDAAGERLGVAVVPVSIAALVNSPRVVMIETISDPEIMAPVIATRNASLAGGLAATFCAIALAILLARSLTRQLVQMTSAVRAFARDEPLVVPVSAGGEIGTLAQAFARMASEMGTKAVALKREIEERRRVFETSLDLIVVVDRQGTFVRVSPSSAAILGYQPEEMIGRGANDFIYPEDIESAHNEMRATRRGQVLRNFEIRYVRKDGRIVTLSWNGVWSQPERRHFLVGRNVTEERIAQRMFQLAVESCPSGMVMIDDAGKVVLVNGEIERQFGYRREEVLGRPIEVLMPHVGAGSDFTGRRKDGTQFPMEVKLNPIQTREGLLVLGVIVDVSERKRMERLKDEFVSTVSHELRTPLTSISGSLGLLVGQWSGKLPESAVRLLAIAHKNSQRLVRLIRDILDIEKMESGRVVFNMSRVDVRELAEQGIEANRGFAEGYGIRVRLEAASSGSDVSADPDRLAQVITNVLSNAIKFSPPQGEVLVAVERNGAAVRMSVRDHGSGIPADFRPHVFEKFAQADATDSRQKGGTGLGLSIVKQIVERLGGEVGFDDAPGGGTVFHVALPAWDHVTKRRVLHVDDDHDVLAAVTAALRTTADVVSVDSLAGARGALAADHIDLAVLDIALGAESGLDLLPDLRDRQGNAIPVIIFSAHGAAPARDEQVQVAFDKANGGLQNLVATVRDRLTRPPAHACKEVV